MSRPMSYALFLVYVQEPDYSALSYYLVEALSTGDIEGGWGFVPVSPWRVPPIQKDRSGWPATL